MKKNLTLNLPINNNERIMISLVITYARSFPDITRTSSINKKLNNLSELKNKIDSLHGNQTNNIELSIQNLTDLLHYSKGITNEFKSYALSGQSMIKEFQFMLEENYPQVKNQNSLALDILPDLRVLLDKLSLIYESNNVNDNEELPAKEISIFKKIINLIKK
tara:strand:+ start:17082 stop:17570 length:489 start_codon:yes stop_codon:yes gene_type:complete